MSGGPQIEITVNDRRRSMASASTLGALMTELGFAERKGIAAAVNGAVVPKSGWPGRILLAADKVIVIQATQGG
jgi:sulfur carrier protein